jgi:tRNA threonylcarbamoyladenosine modification (KEOPS) complex  Pcc1 subunit
MPSINAEIILKIDPKFNESLYKALKPDIGSDKNTKIIIDDNIKIMIDSNDISDLKAKINSYIRLLEVSLNIITLE